MANFPVAIKDIRKLPGWGGFSLLVHTSSPWAPLEKPLAECRVALVSTGGVVRKDDKPFELRGDWSFRKISGETQIESQVRIYHNGYLHKDTDLDINCVFPLDRLRELAQAGECLLAPLHLSFMGMMQNPKPLRDKTAKEAADALAAAGTDAVVLTPGCTISHQAMGLIARQIETQGTPTVCVSLAREVTDQTRVPRTAFVPLPLGHPFGHPNNPEEQSAILRAALGAFAAVAEAGGVVELPFEWGAEYMKGIAKS